MLIGYRAKCPMRLRRGRAGRKAKTEKSGAYSAKTGFLPRAIGSGEWISGVWLRGSRADIAS